MKPYPGPHTYMVISRETGFAVWELEVESEAK